MKQVLIIASTLLLASASVMASGSKPESGNCVGNHTCNTSSDADSSSSSSSSSSSEAASQVGDVTNTYSDNSNISIDAGVNHNAQRRDPVNTAYAAPLVAGVDTCMGSTSAGGQGITLGFSFATTWKDEDCIIRKDARFLQNAQRQEIALSLMCSKPSVLAAVERAGTLAERIACGLDVPVVIPVDSYKPGERG
jgi:hypothetical protein